MKKQGQSETDFFSEYAEFCEPNEQATPPSVVTVRVHDYVKSELMPDLKTTFSQLLLIHVIAGGVTLLICPQFGIGPLGGGSGLVGFVEQYGHIVCGIFCGSFFVSLTTVLSWFFLRNEIQKSIQQNQLAIYLFLALFSFSTLVPFSLMLGGQMPHLHVEFIAPWILSFTVFPITLNWMKRKILAYSSNF